MNLSDIVTNAPLSIPIPALLCPGFCPENLLQCVEQRVLPVGCGRAKHSAHVHIHMLPCVHTQQCGSCSPHCLPLPPCGVMEKCLPWAVTHPPPPGYPSNCVVNWRSLCVTPWVHRVPTWHASWWKGRNVFSLPPRKFVGWDSLFYS